MRVVVLMSTYQGEPYVAEQLDSILRQLPTDGTILIRDDGSRDGTVGKIEQFGDNRITLLRGTNIGFVRSFFALMQAAPVDAEMVMLSDQDDLWLPGRIERAERYLKGRDSVPTLYCSRLQLVDIELKPIGLSPTWPRAPSFQNALTENIITGCTAALNRAALNLVRNPGDVELIYFHDWWLYLVVSAFGEVHADPEPTVLYRQHGGNAIGMGAGINRYVTILRFLRRESWVRIMFNQIENFRTIYATQLSTDKKSTFNIFLGSHKRRNQVRLVFSLRRFRQTWLSEFLFRTLLLCNFLGGRSGMSKSTEN